MYLNNHTYYSLRYGTLSPEQLVELAAKQGLKKLVLTDINNTSGLYDFVQACEKNNIKALAGIEFRKNNKLLYIGIARSNYGFHELCAFLSNINVFNNELPERAPALNQTFFIYPWPNSFSSLRDDEFIGVYPWLINKFLAKTVNLNQDKFVALMPVVIQDDEDFLTHKLLRAIDENTLLSKLEENQICHPQSYFIPRKQLIKYFERAVFLLHNAQKLIDSCDFSPDFKSLKNRKTFTRSSSDDKILLEKLAREGLTYRYGNKNKEALKRLNNELEVIFNLGFAPYFLITWDIIRYAESRGFDHVGRGSGANSVVAYCLNITDVDPIELNLYFERFINSKRSSPPDFDIDFSWDQRDEVIDYVFKRYGYQHVAQLAVYSTFKDKSIIRELAKVFGLPPDEIDALVFDRKLRKENTELGLLVYEQGQKIADFPNYLSIHAGGIVISEEPITCYSALDMPPKGFPITHFDMHVAEAMGYHKFDILSQRGLGHIKEAVEIISENQGKRIDIHKTEKFKKDQKVLDQLESGNCIGCFYIESPAMRGLLKKLRCRDYITLVAASSIIRPGVAKSGMMKEYIKRFHAPERIPYIHPVFEEQLKETYGVMVYQEDVLKILHHFADLDLTDADVLRRMMSGKSRNKVELERIKQNFFNNCRAKKYKEEVIHEVWRQIESFGGYSFAKGHSASYAVESFQSLYLKTYYPKEFMVAVINNFGGFYNTELYVHEARMCGAQILAPCVNNSNYTTCISGDNIYIGFIHVRDLERNIAQAIENERNLNGAYLDLDDFVKRIPIKKEQLILLIRIGAFRFTQISRKELLWQKNAVLSNQQGVPYSNLMLIHENAHHYQLPNLEEFEFEEAFEQIELLGFPLCSPFDLLQTKHRGDVMAKDLPKFVNKEIRMMGYYVCRKDVKTIKGEIMNFGTFVDVEGNFFDTVHFPPSLKKYPFAGKGIYLFRGKVVEEFGFCSLEVSQMARLPYIKDPRYD